MKTARLGFHITVAGRPRLHKPLFIGSEAASWRPIMLLSHTDNHTRISRVVVLLDFMTEDITAKHVGVSGSTAD